MRPSAMQIGDFAAQVADLSRTSDEPFGLLALFCSLLVVVVIIPADPTHLVLAAAPELLSVRIVAAIALLAVVVAFVHVLLPTR